MHPMALYRFGMVGSGARRLQLLRKCQPGGLLMTSSPLSASVGPPGIVHKQLAVWFLLVEAYDGIIRCE
jgi:hypothetical protein